MLTADQLLTVKDVAKTLQISPRTVYDNAHRLGGFYPAGLRVLRFPPGVILGYLEGQDSQRMGLQIRVPEEGLRGTGLCDTTGSRRRQRKPAEDSGKRIKTDPSRHGL
jgi:predicted DNA-binding transcriptional regulator AlpA